MNCIFRIARTLWLGRTAKFCIVLSAPKINRLKLQSAQITGQFESIHLCFPSSLSVKVLSHCNQNQTQDAVCSCFTFHDQIRNNYGTWSELEIKKFARGIRIDFLYFWFQYRTALSTVHTDLDKTTEPDETLIQFRHPIHQIWSFPMYHFWFLIILLLLRYYYPYARLLVFNDNWMPCDRTSYSTITSIT